MNLTKRDDRTVLLTYSGAPGDHCYALPALRRLSHLVKHVLMCAEWRGGLVKAVYENSNIIEKFVWFDSKQMEGWTDDQKAIYLVQECADYDVSEHRDMNGIIAGNYMTVPPFDKRIEDAREDVEHVNFFDVFCDVLNVSEAKGTRPKFWLSDEETLWLDAFHKAYAIEKEYRLVGWQWSGSSDVKEFPDSERFVKSLLDRYDDIFVIFMGSQRFADRKFKHRRAINLAGRIRWRQAVLLTKLLSLYVAPDTSVMVAAQAFKTLKKIMLATTTSGKQYAFPETTIIQSRANCSPCYRIVNECSDDDCCGKLDSDEIMAAVDDILKEG